MRLPSEIDYLGILQQIVREGHGPLSAIREGISNAWDAGASHCLVRILPEENSGLTLEIQDDGSGIAESEFRYFFGTGFQYKRGQGLIGHKGLGTKLFFNSRKLTVESTTSDGNTIRAIMKDAGRALAEGRIPSYDLDRVNTTDLTFSSGTRVNVAGYPGTLRSPVMARDYLSAHLKWFTAAGRTRKLLRGSDRSFSVRLERQMSTGTVFTAVFDGHTLPRMAEGDLDSYEHYARPFESFSFELTNDRGDKLGTAEVVGAIAGSRGHIVADKRIKKLFKGIFLGTDYVLLKNVSHEVFGGTGEWQNLHVVVNCNELEPSMNRAGFADSGPGSTYAEVINSLRKFSYAIRSGIRFSYRGRVIEQGSEYAGKLFQEFQQIRSLQTRIDGRSERIVSLFSTSQRRRLPSHFRGGPIVEPTTALGVLLTFQALLSLVSEESGHPLAGYRVIGPADDTNGVFLQRKVGDDWGDPLYYRASLKVELETAYRLLKAEECDGFICWETAKSSALPDREEYDGRLLVLLDLVQSLS